MRGSSWTSHAGDEGGSSSVLVCKRLQSAQRKRGCNYSSKSKRQRETICSFFSLLKFSCVHTAQVCGRQVEEPGTCWVLGIPAPTARSTVERNLKVPGMARGSTSGTCGHTGFRSAVLALGMEPTWGSASGHPLPSAQAPTGLIPVGYLVGHTCPPSLWEAEAGASWV